MGYANIGSHNRGKNIMESKAEDKGITDDRKSEADDAAEINESGGVKGCACCGETECHIEWTDD